MNETEGGGGMQRGGGLPLAASCPSVCGDSPYNEVQMQPKKIPCRLLLSSAASQTASCDLSKAVKYELVATCDLWLTLTAQDTQGPILDYGVGL